MSILSRDTCARVKEKAKRRCRRLAKQERKEMKKQMALLIEAQMKNGVIQLTGPSPWF